MSNVTTKERLAAVALHLFYLPAFLMIFLIAVIPEAWTTLATLTTIWLMLEVGLTLLRPESKFLASHVRQSRRYHLRAFTFCVVAFLIIFMSGLVTFGAGFAFAPAFVACALIVFMFPTFSAARKAWHGELYSYGVNQPVAKGQMESYLERAAQRQQNAPSAT